MDKMSQKTMNGGVGIQVNGDINYGVSSNEITKIINSLYELNFPKLVEEASIKAQENVEIFLKSFLEDIKNDITQIQEKLRDPNNQYLLNASVLQSARFGDKANIHLLTKALKNALLIDNNNLSSVLTLALELIPQLSKEELLAILISFLIHTIGTRFTEIPPIEFFVHFCLLNYMDYQAVSENQLYHMVSLGIYALNPFAGDKCIDLLARRYSNIPDFREQVRNGQFKCINYIINYYDNNGLVKFHPLPVANVIGFLLVKNNVPSLDISILGI